MKKNVITVCLLVMSMSLIAQKQDRFREEMISSGEKQVPVRYQNSSDDYQSFLKSKAWNTRVSAGIFTNAKELGINGIGGRVRATLVDKTNNIALVAPSGGGLWKFNQATGSSFVPINDFGSFLAITDIAQNPNNAQNILVATGDELHGTVGNGVFQSTNGGTSFSKMTSIDPNTNADFRYIRFIKFSPTQANTLYLVAGTKLYKSTNSGTSWTLVFTAPSTLRSIDFLPNQGVIVSANSNGLYSSTTGDASSFSLITTTIPNNPSGSTSALTAAIVTTHAADRNIAYALFTGTTNSLYKTTNGGSTWTKLTTPTFYISQTWFCLTLGVHPTNPNILVGGSIGWGYSKDGGQTWKDGADLEVDFHSVHFHTSNPDVAYLGYDQGFGSVNFAKEVDTYVWNGSSYVVEKQPEQIEVGKNAGFNTTQIYYGDYYPQSYGDSFLEGQQDGGSFSRLIYGNTNIQTRFIVGDGGSIFINKQDPLKAFASTQNGYLHKSTEGLNPVYGKFSQFGNAIYNNHPNFITQFEGNNADGNQLYISDNTSIQRTNNGGTSFSSIASHALKDVVVAVENAANPVVYALGRNSTNFNSDIIRIASANGTPTVSTLSAMLTYSTDNFPETVSIDPNNANTIYITSSKGNAYKISNANTASPTKTSIKGDASTVVFNYIIGVKGKPNLLIAGTNVGLFYSENGGTNWVLSSDIPYTQVTDLKLRESDNRLFVFTHGRGAWAVTLSPSVTSLADDQSSNSSVEVFPNPIKESFSIKSEAINPTFVLFDVQGNKVLETTQPASIPTKGLTSGTYIVHVLENNELIATKKVVIE